MATPMKMTAEAVASRLEEDYSSGAPYQWAIEWLRNVWAKPTATEAFIRIVEIPGNGTRLVMIDNGAPITEDLLYEYIATLGAGDGSMWRLDNMEGNRHAGLRASILPWADMTVAVWDDDIMPNGLEIELFYDPATTTYESSDVVALDPDMLAALRKEVTPYADSPDEIPGLSPTHSGAFTRGVAFILFDRDDTKDGPFYDERKGETSGGVQDALRDRVYAAVNQATGDPLRIVAEVTMPLADTKDKKGGGAVVNINGAPTRLDSREIKGIQPWLDRPSVTGDPLVVDDYGTRIHWWLLDELGDNRRLMNAGRGIAAIRYKNELMPLSDRVQNDMRRFGIVLSAVYDRLAIVIEPPTSGPGWHVKQNPARSRVESFNGLPLPLDEWAEAFVTDMPLAIRDANAAARSLGISTSNSHLARVMEKFTDRFKVLAASRRRKPGTGVIGEVANDTPAPSADPGDEARLPREGGVGSVTVVKPSENKGGRTNGVLTVNRPHTGTGAEESVFRAGAKRRARRARDVPAEVAVEEKAMGMLPEYLSNAEWHARFDGAADVDPYGYFWDRVSKVLTLNVDHPVHELAIDYYTGAWLDARPNIRRRATTEEIRDAVLEAYFLDTLTGISAAVRLHGSEGRAHLEMTPEVMTKSHYNTAGVDALIEPWLGALGSTRRAVVA